MIHKLNQLRIIGGKWRSRKLAVAQNCKIRPTTDFVRETLFNWLAPIISEAICLDLFAGSGALGFEALSRGAKKVVMLDQSRNIIATLKKNAETLNIQNLDFYCMIFSTNLAPPFTQQFDIVFLDPPFRKNLVVAACVWLEKNNLLKDTAYIYTEAEKELTSLQLPENWQQYRFKTSGQVNYSLWIRNKQHLI